MAIIVEKDLFFKCCESFLGLEMSGKEVHELSIRPITCFSFNKDCSRKYFFTDISISAQSRCCLFTAIILLKLLFSGQMVSLNLHLKNRVTLSYVMRVFEIMFEVVNGEVVTYIYFVFQSLPFLQMTIQYIFTRRRETNGTKGLS